MEIVPRLEPATLAGDATPVRRSLSALTGILKIHLAMEDRSFYPYLLEHRPVHGRLPEDVQGVADRGERVAQLVRQHRQELVLQPVGLAQLGVEPGVFDGARRARCQVLATARSWES